MTMRGFRYRLVPTNEQQVLLRQHVGVWRLVYNLALEQRRNWWRGGRSFSYASQCRELTALRAAFDWIAAVSQTCQQQALSDLGRAYEKPP